MFFLSFKYEKWEYAARNFGDFCNLINLWGIVRELFGNFLPLFFFGDFFVAILNTFWRFWTCFWQFWGLLAILHFFGDLKVITLFLLHFWVLFDNLWWFWTPFLAFLAQLFGHFEHFLRFCGNSWQFWALFDNFWVFLAIF